MLHENEILPTLSSEELRAYALGFEANELGKWPSANPFESENLSRCWRDGWKRAEGDRGEANE